MLRLKDRENVFKSGRRISNNIGDIAQNEMQLRETDILLEFIKVEDLINELQNYKRLVISNLEQVF